MTNGWNFWRLWIVACLLIDAVLKYSSSILSVICLTLSAILSFYLHDAIPARCLSQIPVTGICKPVLCRNGWADQAFFRVYWRFILQCIKGFGYFRKLLSNSGLRKVLSRHVDSCKFFSSVQLTTVPGLSHWDFSLQTKFEISSYVSKM